jgi:hypothetical protein
VSALPDAVDRRLPEDTAYQEYLQPERLATSVASLFSF